jgi:hypothetical protein
MKTFEQEGMEGTEKNAVLQSVSPAHFRGDITSDFTDFTDETLAVPINPLAAKCYKLLDS